MRLFALMRSGFARRLNVETRVMWVAEAEAEVMEDEKKREELEGGCAYVDLCILCVKNPI